MLKLTQERIYERVAQAWFIREVDQPSSSLNFHIQSQDYFGTAATLIGFMEERVTKYIQQAEQDRQKLLVLQQELMRLQANYQIVPRSNK